MTQLYVGNLSADGDEKAIRALFSRYGVVREVLMKNGYAFVEFEDACSADTAMRDLNGESALLFCVVCVHTKLQVAAELPFPRLLSPVFSTCWNTIATCFVRRYASSWVYCVDSMLRIWELCCCVALGRLESVERFSVVFVRWGRASTADGRHWRHSAGSLAGGAIDLKEVF